jgi:hypothetical protein
MGSVPNYNTSNPSTNYTGAANPPAIMLLALMPAFDLNQLTDATADGIAAQCARINDRWGIPIMMRFGHEMNGNWNAYSQRPLSYVATFRKLTLAIRRRTNLTAMVWAPNFGSGYPYNSPNRFTPAPFSAEWNATDTNRDGKFDGKDDPYTPYWPGADYVDWVGMSAYWLSYSWPMGTNQVTPPDYLESIVNGTNYEALQHSQPPWDIYESGYCERSEVVFAVDADRSFQSPSVLQAVQQTLHPPGIWSRILPQLHEPSEPDYRSRRDPCPGTWSWRAQAEADVVEAGLGSGGAAQVAFVEGNCEL